MHIYGKLAGLIIKDGTYDAALDLVFALAIYQFENPITAVRNYFNPKALAAL